MSVVWEYARIAGIFIRIAGIIVGVATLLRVAATEKLVSYDPLFQQWLDILSERIDWAFLLPYIGPFLHWGIDQVRSLGISVPDLQDEWRPAFVLSMLILAAVGRHSRSGFLVVAAPVGALVVAVWSGLAGSLAPVALAASFAAFSVPVTPDAANFTWGAGLLAVGTLLASLFPTSDIFSAPVTLVFLVSLVAFVATSFLLAGIVEFWEEDWHGGLRAVLAKAKVNIGIDILFTMSLAFVIAVAAANPPIW